MKHGKDETDARRDTPEVIAACELIIKSLPRTKGHDYDDDQNMLVAYASRIVARNKLPLLPPLPANAPATPPTTRNISNVCSKHVYDVEVLTKEGFFELWVIDANDFTHARKIAENNHAQVRHVSLIG